jgi:DNA-binding response OmpR family regulator
VNSNNNNSSSQQVDLSVLVVEDDPAISRLMTMTLELKGYRVFCSMNGVDAREYLRGDGGDGWPVDLVLVDLFMPLLDGLGLLHWIRSQPRERLPVVVTTSMHSERVAHEVEEAGADRIFYKPVDLSALLEEIGVLLSD